MAGGKLTPRQKMINMMYLVLTALLAMNVSKEVLDSFVIVNNGLETTKRTLAEKMDETYTTFSSYAQQNQEKYGAAFKSAQQVQTMAKDLLAMIDKTKAEVVSVTEGKPVDQVFANDTLINLKYIEKKDDYDAPTNLMIGADETKPKDGDFSAVQLRTKLEAFRDQLLGLVGDKNPVLKANIEKTFSFPKEKEAGDSGVEVSWETKQFYHVPLAATVTILSKIQGDVRNMENETVNWLMGNVEKSSFKFNKLTAIVKPQSSYVTVGSKYQAEVFLGAYDDQNIPEVYICGPGAKVDTTSKPYKIVGDAQKLPMNGAKAQLEQVAGGAGLRTVTGIIKFKPVGGEEQVERFETEYEVAAPNLVVSPTKMNVFYRGIDNPVDISVAGYSAKDITPSITNGTLSKAAQGFIVKPGKDAKSMVSVTVTNPDGSKKSLPGLEFRVKNVPSPQPYFGGKTISDQTIKKSDLQSAAGVIAKLEAFEFDLKFDVVEYTVSATVTGSYAEDIVKGAAVSGKAKEIFGKLKTGQKVYIENVKVKAPDGTIRTIGNLAFKVI
jgi:gliding motility-associated protein GldM